MWKLCGKGLGDPGIDPSSVRLGRQDSEICRCTSASTGGLAGFPDRADIPMSERRDGMEGGGKRNRSRGRLRSWCDPQGARRRAGSRPLDRTAAPPMANARAVVLGMGASADGHPAGLGGHRAHDVRSHALDDDLGDVAYLVGVGLPIQLRGRQILCPIAGEPMVASQPGRSTSWKVLARSTKNWATGRHGGSGG